MYNKEKLNTERLLEKNGDPEFMAGPSSFKVVLPNMNLLIANKPEREIDPEAEQALKYISEQGEVSRNDVEKYLGISTSAAIRLMKRLKDSGLITAGGKGKNVRYTIE